MNNRTCIKYPALYPRKPIAQKMMQITASVYRKFPIYLIFNVSIELNCVVSFCNKVLCLFSLSIIGTQLSSNMNRRIVMAIKIKSIFIYCTMYLSENAPLNKLLGPDIKSIEGLISALMTIGNPLNL